MIHEIYIIDDENNLINDLHVLFKNEKDYKLSSVKTKDLDVALKKIPAMMIINEDNIDINTVELCQRIRNDEDNSITPIIVVSSIVDKLHRIEILKHSVEYYIRKPIDNEYLYYTIKNITRLLYTNRRVSPLTGLPGNVQIQTEMKKRLLNDENFAMLYFDLDNFKAYNDVYGFSNGDEIIKFTANIICKNTHNAEYTANFVGHIGGDDFVAIVGEQFSYEDMCQNIILEFDTLVQEYYTAEDAQRGYIEVANRRGIIEQFPIVSISIGVVEVDCQKYSSTLEIGEVGAQVKHQAKTVMGSTYIINKRK